MIESMQTIFKFLIKIMAIQFESISSNWYSFENFKILVKWLNAEKIKTLPFYNISIVFQVIYINYINSIKFNATLQQQDLAYQFFVCNTIEIFPIYTNHTFTDWLISVGQYMDDNIIGMRIRNRIMQTQSFQNS